MTRINNKHGGAMSNNPQKGISLLENMVALLVTTIGLFGLSGLQLTSFTNSNKSSSRAIATAQANIMLDRILANKAAVYMDPANPQYWNITPPAILPAADCSLSNCTPFEIAEYDVYQWNSENAQLLPGGGGWIQGQVMPVAGPAGLPQRVQYSVTIRWDGARNGATGLGCDPNNTADLHCLTLKAYP